MYLEHLDFLYSLQKHGIKLGLDKMVEFLAVIGNPQNKIKLIHVAGTNGKGSCSSFIASILTEKGLRAGLYTSPHFVRFNERIRIGSQFISDEVIAAFVAQHRTYFLEHQFTFFEATTALAFQYFSDQEVDYAVIETGLGGRFDATNVCNPLVSVITSIGLEHTEYLGTTIAEIAFEKAGIIKQNVPVCVGMVTVEAEKVIHDISLLRNSSLLLLREHYSSAEHLLRIGETFITDLSSPLRGDYQFENAALACLAADSILHEADYSLYQKALKNVLINTAFEGRFEVYVASPQIIFDSAHNPDGVKRLADELAKDRNTYTKTTILFTALRDKKVNEMILSLTKVSDDILITTLDFPRALTASEIKSLTAQLSEYNCSYLENPGKFVEEFQEHAEYTQRLVITGSMYLVGEVKAYLSKSQNKFI